MLNTPPIREVMTYDVVIVGAGPAGLSAAIRLKKLGGDDVSVCVLEKGAEVGAHILSGAVFDPRALEELIPDWKERGAPLDTPVNRDDFYLLGPAGSMRLPNWLRPSFLKSKGSYILSLGALCQWLAREAEALGVEIYPGFSASSLLYDGEGRVNGVVAGVFGLDRDRVPKPSYQPGVEIRGSYLFLSEGARGSLTKEVIARFRLSEGRSPQKFGLGIKEIWEIPKSQHYPGRVIHTLGWPLGSRTGGGGFAYHFGENLVSIGFVVHLDYDNPHLSPYLESQRYKHHPLICDFLKGGRRVSYGARVISEGGYQSLPHLTFPGGALLGCAAGVVNVPKIKGSHNAMKTGILAATAAFSALKAPSPPALLEEYESSFHRSWVAEELKIGCNVKPLWSRLGMWGGLVLGGLDVWTRSTLGFSFFGALPHQKPDHATLKPAQDSQKISYPPPDGTLSFDRLTNMAFSGTSHGEDQPVHLLLSDPSVPISHTLPLYDEPAQRYCPAQVYEVVTDEKGEAIFRINAQNCLHCKTCDIKDPAQNITWSPPQGGEGPRYQNM